MRFGKISLGLILLLATGSEYINASQELGSYVSPKMLIASFSIILLSTWLIGSALVKGKFNLFSIGNVAFFILSSLIFIFSSVLTLYASIPPSKIESVNEISLLKCNRGNKDFISDASERQKYCRCLAEKIMADTTNRYKYRYDLKAGRLDQIIKKISAEGGLIDLGIEYCIPAKGVSWTEEIIASTKAGLIKNLRGTEFEESNDIEEYCDCLLREYSAHPFHDVMNEDYLSSEASIDLENYCAKSSLKDNYKQQEEEPKETKI